ncbi:MAG: apolipoprotein N-acyltransferase [Cyanobacteriota bacterium]
MGNHRRFWALAAIAGGVLAGVALPPVGWPWLLWPALALLWAVAGSPHRSTALAAAALWGGAAVLVSHRWLLWLHPLDWIGVPAPLSLPLCLVVWAFCGGVGGLLVAAWVALLRPLDPTRLDTALVAALGWGLAEVVLARGPLFWLGLGASALPGDPALAALAALAGAGAIAALQVLIGWGLWRALQLGALRGRPRALALPLALLLVAHGPGWALAVAPVHGGDGASENVMVVQPAIPTRRKFEAGSQRRLLNQLDQALSSLPAASARDDGVPAGPGTEAKTTIVVLPEGALPLGQPLPRAATAEVLAGGFRQQDGSVRSSVLRFGPGERYASSAVDKHRLVPLGEWVPLARLVRWSGLSAVGGLDGGAPSRLLPRPAGAIGVAICYELADGTALAQASRAGARWLLASANLDPYPRALQAQFTALARLRAIETGRWLVSVANTGPSLVVDASGQVRSTLPVGIAAVETMTVRQRQSLTAYVRWGNGPLLLGWLLALLLRFWPRPAGVGNASGPMQDKL